MRRLSLVKLSPLSLGLVMFYMPDESTKLCKLDIDATYAMILDKIQDKRRVFSGSRIFFFGGGDIKMLMCTLPELVRY